MSQDNPNSKVLNRTFKVPQGTVRVDAQGRVSVKLRPTTNEQKPSRSPRKEEAQTS